MIRILFIGDIVGRPGRDLVRRGLTPIVAHHRIDFVIANVENAAAGFGVTPDLAADLLELGVDVMTGGNHTYDKKEIVPYFAYEPRLLRPANFPDGAPGLGRHVARTRGGVSVGVVNAIGRVFMAPLDDPFVRVREEVKTVSAEARVVLVDFHAEATSEKVAMGWHLDGQVSAVVGTHTHVQTADNRVLPNGTAYITDVGMTGGHDGVIGVDRQAILQRFMSGLPQRFEVATGDPRLNGVIVTADETTGRAQSIDRLSLTLKEIETLAGEFAAQEKS
jgi:metallophosphoesterase (TIGR00282 family)